MERVHQTRRRVAQGLEAAPEMAVRQDAPPRGRGRGRGAAPRGRGRGRGIAAEAPIQPPAQDVTELLNAMQQRMEAQAAEMQGLREELLQAQTQARARAEDQAPPPAPPARQPAAHQVAIVPNPNLYEKFRRMKAPDFEGSSDPLVADEWLAQI